MRYLTAAAFVLLSALSASAQIGFPPSKTPKASTPEEDRRIQAAAALHDQEKFDEAIAQYQEILSTSPTNMTALYELAFSQLGKKDYAKARETATRGVEYRSEMLPMFYDVISETHDAEGHPDLAIDTYKKGLLIAPDATLLYHNMAITYLEELKNPDEARRALQKGLDVDPTEPELQLMLGQVYKSSGYETPAFLALSTYLMFEPNGPRSLQAIGVWRQILRGGLAASSGAPGGGADAAMRDAAQRPRAKIDEGDFSAIDAQYAIGQQKIIDAMDKGAGEMPTLLAQLDDLFTRLAARPAAADQGTFVGRRYLPYFAELKRRNLVEPFTYWVLQRAPIGGVKEWITQNRARVQEFIDFTRGFAWAKS